MSYNGFSARMTLPHGRESQLCLLRQRCCCSTRPEKGGTYRECERKQTFEILESERSSHTLLYSLRGVSFTHHALYRELRSNYVADIAKPTESPSSRHILDK